MEERFELLSDSFLYYNGYSKEEIETLSEEEKLKILQDLDLKEQVRYE